MHSYCALPTSHNVEWILALTDYGEQRYVSMVSKGNVMAAQFHPEKSGGVGLEMIGAFLRAQQEIKTGAAVPAEGVAMIRPATSLTELSQVYDFSKYARTQLANRVIACLDVRSNDAGDLVVTKGDQYDVREADSDAAHPSGR